jgi:Tfp pilus assembly protein PilF
MKHLRWIVLSVLAYSLIRCASAPPPAPSAAVHIRNGVRMLKRGNCEGAEAQFERALHLNPISVPALYGAAVAELACGKDLQAEAHLHRALRVAKSTRWKARIHATLAYLYDLTGHPRKARHHWNQAMKLDISNELVKAYGPGHRHHHRHPRGSVRIFVVWLEE